MKHEALDKYIASNLLNFNNESDLYYKPKSLDDWYSYWDFKDFDPNIYNHGLHQYPARFIPQLARKMLRTFTNSESTVLDIFSGSGTTLLEAKYLGIKKSIGIELNPFAVFMSKTKLDDIDAKITMSKFSCIKKKYFENSFVFKRITFKNIDFWYTDNVINDLSKLIAAIKTISDEKIRNFYLLAFCDVTRKTSYLDYNGFKMYRSRTKISKNYSPAVWQEFEKDVDKNLKLLAENNSITANNKTEQIVIQGDSRYIHNEIKKDSVDFILTSPPYGDSRTTVAYGQYSRLPWQWLSEADDIIKLDSTLLGGNTKNIDKEILNYSKTLRKQTKEIEAVDGSKRVLDVIAFYNDLYASLKSAYFYLKSNHYFVLVTGNRTVKKVYLRTDLIISEFGEKLGFSAERILSRNIINKRMARKNSPTNEKGKTVNTMMTENMIILKKR